MPEPGKHWTDDSSATLGLDHSPTSGASSGPRSRSGGIEAHFGPQVETHKRVASELLEKRIRELCDQGHSIVKARKLAEYERDHPIVKSEIEDHEGNRLRATEDLMDMHRGGGSHGVSPPKHDAGKRWRIRTKNGVQIQEEFMKAKSPSMGGSSSGRRRENKKPGVASEPHILASYDGRTETIEGEPRDNHRGVAMSDSTDAAIAAIKAETGVNLPALIAAIAALRGRNDAAAQFALATILRAAPTGKRGAA